MASIQVRAMPLAGCPDHGFHQKFGGRSVVSLPEVVVRAQRMDARRGFVIAVLGGATFLAAGCTRGLDSAATQMMGTGGVMSGAGGGGGNTEATDARVKADSVCLYDVDAAHVSTENASDACLFAIDYPTDTNAQGEDFRIVVDGIPLMRDPTNGWTYTDATQRVVRIVGPACDAFKAGAVQTVWVEWYCTGIP
jgi:hypothetical protein